MRIVAIFDDTPAMADIRRRLEPEHLAYLRANLAEIRLGGGLRESDVPVFVGGLWILEVESRERAVQLIEDDPYFLAEPRPYRLLLWGKPLRDVEVVL
jgi:uncharacterized protein